MSELQFNQRAWDQIAKRGDDYYVTADHEAVERARSGCLEIKLTPIKNVPRQWFGDVRDSNVLGLAAGGGMQGPLLAAAGARTTVFDLSEVQLQRDRKVAQRFGLDLETVQGDMTDLSVFQDSSFDLIVNPCSVCFCRHPEYVWREVFRILRPGGYLLAGLINPVNYLFDFFEAERDRLLVRYRIPFDSSQLNSEDCQRWLGEERPIEYGHSLQQLIGAQLQAGMLLAGFYEDRWGDHDVLSDHLPVFFATRTRKPDSQRSQ